ncbi:MAG: hypothetical protein ACJA0X_000705 [Cyclobacteriaceae bacterium]|jgi:hypothetical protein
MHLINKISRTAFVLIFGKKEAYVLRASRTEPDTYRVLNENGATLFQGSMSSCRLFKETMESQLKGT